MTIAAGRGTARSGVWFEAPGEDGIGRVLIDRPDDAVNALNRAQVEALESAVREARARDGLRGLIVASARLGQWIAGADLDLVAGQPHAARLEEYARRFQAICDLLAWMPCTTVAAIGGPALGGGFEVALACDYRVAARSKAVTVGLPEVSLGLVPAGGGTQRLPRLVGLAEALDLILAGRRLNAPRARLAGLLDEVVDPATLDQAALAWARKPKRSLERPLKLGLRLGAAMDAAELTPHGRRLLYRRAREGAERRTRGHYPAPLRALDAVEIGMERGLAAGLDAEARAFAELATGPIARKLIWLFMATQRQKKIGGLSDGGARPRAVERIGVVGAGFMGSGIAQSAAAAGYPVRIRDVNPEAVAKGLASARQVVEESVARRRLTRQEGEAVLDRLSCTTDYSGFANADLAIEAVFEELSLKQAVVRELEATVGSDAVIASNTSALPIGQIASAAERPERIVGTHFFSPVHRMPLLEVVRAAGSAEWAVATAVAVGNRLSKTVIVVGDGPGFYTSRVLGAMMSEATELLDEGADMDGVDRAMTSFGFPVGPFVLYDEVGLDVAQHVGQTMSRAFPQRQGRSPIVDQLVAAGRTGRKSGKGFLDWAQRERALPVKLPFVPEPRERSYDPLVYEILGNPSRREFTSEAIQDRLVLAFVNEAIRCLGEGVLRSPTDGDLGAVLGLGFPPFRGGPFHYADHLGLSTLRSKLVRLADRHGARYEPAERLVEMEKAGRKFYEGDGR